MCDVSFSNGRTVQVDIAHLMAVAAIKTTADVPAVQRVEGDVETHAHVGTPVAVDVLRSCGAGTSFLIVSYDVTNGIIGGSPAGVDIETPVALRLGNLHTQTIGDERCATHHLEVSGEIGGERRF